MRVPLSWLADHVEVTVPVSELAERLTFAGLEVEDVEHVGEEIAGVVTARVLAVAAHPGADRLALVRVDAGGEEREVVCGAHNYVAGDIVPLAGVGAKLPGGVEVGRKTVRGVVSDGMLCSARELGVFDDHAGILILPAETALGEDFVEAVGLHDTVLELKSYPNRGDTMSIRGVAREVAQLLGVELKPVDTSVVESGPDTDDLAGVAVVDDIGCKVYAARVIEGVEAVRPAPLWMARRLYLCGMRPLGAVVDVTNFVLLDQGQPLHAFDLDRVPDARIVVRRGREGERLQTLDGRWRMLGPDDTLIAAGRDGAEAVALAGIMGGADSEVTDSTSRVLLESAHFPPEGVRATMARLGMATEGGQRWARGVDPELARPMADRAARLIAELAGGSVSRGRLEAGPGAPPRETIRLDWARSSRRLGAPPEPSFGAAYLEGVGCTTSIDGGDVLATPPSWRFDLLGWADLEEEVARHWGYGNLPATLPQATGGRRTAEQGLRNAARSILAGMGLTEVLTSPFLGAGFADSIGLAPDDPRRRALRIANPLSEEAPLLRTTLVPGLAEVARRNLAKGVGAVAIYEIGNVFLGRTTRTGGAAIGRALPPDAHGDAELPHEPRMLGVLLSGQRPLGPVGTALEFADVKGVVEGLVAGLGVPGCTFRADDPMPYHPGRCAAIALEGRTVGHLGQLHPRVCAALELLPASFVAELELTPLLQAVPAMRPARTPSPYPELTFDVAFLVPPGTAASDLAGVLVEAAGGLLTRQELFDAYEGPPLPPGYRNLAYRVVLQADDRTLTDDEAAQVRTTMQRLAATRLGAQLRSA